MPTKTKQLENKKIPKLRFPGFSGEWEEKKLGDVFSDIKSGKDKPESRGEYFVYGSTGVIGSTSQFTYEGAHILIARVGANAGRLNCANGKFGVTDNTLILGNNKNANITFFLNFLESKKLNRLVFGSGQPLVTSGHLKKLRIVVPTNREEQQKIAEFLGAVDEWTENLRNQKEVLEAYKKGMMQKIFASPCHSLEGGNPASRIRFKDDNGNNFPEWEEKTIGQVLKIGSGKDYKQLGHGNIPVFGTGGYMLSVNKALYSGESVFIGRKGTINKPFYYNGDFWTVDTLFYTYDFSEIIPKFTYLVFQQINWLKYNEASGVPSLSKTTIEKIKINLPYIAEQQIITKYFTAIEDLINSKQQQITQAEEWKKGLMQGLLV